MRLRFRRHYRLLIALGLLLGGLVAGLGNQRIIAYTVPGVLDSASLGVGRNYTNDVALFDETLVHSVQILIDEEDYQKMLTTYQETGAKDYFHADVIIDGVRVNNVGLRLKGNASLQTALGRGGRQMPGGGGGGNRGQLPGGAGQAPAAGAQPQQVNPPNRPAQGERPAFPAGQQPEAPPAGNGQMPAQPAGPQAGAGPMAAQPVDTAAASNTAKIPLLLKFDEFVSAQSYQGYRFLAIRTYGISSDAAMLQEPVTNAMARLAGLPATQTAYAGVRLNDGEEQLFVLSEVIDETYLARYFPYSNGILYKAELGATLSYQGEDPSAYATSFTQQTRVNDADLAPLIKFMRFLDESDDATFASELPDYLDVEAFATYLALNNLLVNTDSIAGMNNNYYLYYDDLAERFTLLMWDANESLGKLSGGGQAASYDLYFQTQSQPGMGGGRRMGLGGGRGLGGGANTLVTRFMATPSFLALYEQKLQEVYQAAFASGALTQQIEQYATLVRQTNQERALVNSASYEAAVTQVLNFVAQRSAYLASTTLLGGQSAQSQ